MGLQWHQWSCEKKARKSDREKWSSLEIMTKHKPESGTTNNYLEWRPWWWWGAMDGISFQPWLVGLKRLKRTQTHSRLDCYSSIVPRTSWQISFVSKNRALTLIYRSLLQLVLLLLHLQGWKRPLKREWKTSFLSIDGRRTQTFWNPRLVWIKVESVPRVGSSFWIHLAGMHLSSGFHHEVRFVPWHRKSEFNS